MKAILSFALLATVALAEPPNYRQQQQQQQQGQRYFFARQQQESGPYPPSGWKPNGPAFNLPQRQPLQLQQQQQQPTGAYGAPQQSQLDNAYGAPQLQVESSYGAPQQQQPNQYGAPLETEFAAASSSSSSSRQQTSNELSGQFARQPQQQQQRFPASQQEQRFASSDRQRFNQQLPQQQYGAPEYATTDYPNESDIDEPVTVGGLPDSESEPLSNANELQDEGDLDDPRANQRSPKQQPQSQQQQERGEYYVALPDGRLQRVRYVSRQDLEAMRYFAKIRADNVEPLRGPIYAYAPLQRLEVAPGQLRIEATALAPATASLTPALEVQVSPTESAEKSQKFLAAATPKVEVKQLAQIQLQHDEADLPVAPVLPLGTSYAAYTAAANYRQVPTTATGEERFILAFP